MTDLRSLPSVDRLLQTTFAQDWLAAYGRPLTLEAIRRALDEVRSKFSNGGGVPSEDELIDRIHELLDEWTEPSLQPVVNATGVVLHTNLGRAPLSIEARRAVLDAAVGYSNLEFDLATGKRGSRLVHSEELLKRLTGVEAALVINNNAAAVLLALTALAKDKKVVIARSQLVEIGGGFRIPDVMKQSGAQLVEVGTTNRVHFYDFEQALEEEDDVALLMRAHPSNFRIIGFTSEPALGEISALAHRKGLFLVDDLGSGSFIDTARFGLSHEPTIQESVESGADLICFSGDKLLGGPQAGIIIGRAQLVARLKKHPLARAIRADKLCLAGLSATLMHYLKDEAVQKIPIWQMIATQPETIRSRAAGWVEKLGRGEVISGLSTIGGGSLPGEMLPTFLLALDVHNSTRFLEMLRMQRTPVIARLEEDRVLFDPRTVLPNQDEILLSAIQVSLDGS